MIATQDISKTINNKKLFKFINLIIEDKKITGLLGANGAGKTSLFRAIAGLTKIDSGKLILNGKDVTNLNLEQRAKLGLSYVPQENSLFEELSLIENIKLVMELKFNAITKDQEKKLSSLLDKMGLIKKTDKIGRAHV